MKHVVFALAFLLFCSACRRTPSAQTRTTRNPEIPITGPEVWDINGTAYQIEGTSWLLMGNGRSLFVIKAIVEFTPSASHRPVAAQLAKYATDNGYTDKMKGRTWQGRPVPYSGSIGVTLCQTRGLGSAHVFAGYRYNFDNEEL